MLKADNHNNHAFPKRGLTLEQAQSDMKVPWKNAKELYTTLVNGHGNFIGYGNNNNTDKTI